MSKDYSKKRPKSNNETEQTAQEGGNEMTNNTPVNYTCTFAKLQQSGSKMTPEKADKVFAKICPACKDRGSTICLSEGRLALGGYFDKYELDLATNKIPSTESNTVANIAGSVKNGTVFVSRNAYGVAKTVVQATATGAIFAGENVAKGAVIAGKGLKGLWFGFRKVVNLTSRGTRYLSDQAVQLTNDPPEPTEPLKNLAEVVE